MKPIVLKTLSTIILGLTISGTANATLESRTVDGIDFLYDNVLDITWLIDGLGGRKQMTFVDANGWAESLKVGGRDDWRLPTMSPTGKDFDSTLRSDDGSTDFGHNIKTGSSVTTVYSEMGSLFYDTLGNFGSHDSKGNDTSCRGSSTPSCLSQKGLFTTLQHDSYWTGVDMPNLPGYTNAAGLFSFNSGTQIFNHKNNKLYALAVSSGDISAVPVPAAVWLMGSALLGLVGIGRKKVGTD